MPTTWWDEPAWPVPPAEDRSCWGDLPDPEAVAVVVKAATQRLGTPWPQTSASGWARIHRDADRDAYEQVLWARERRLSEAVLAACATLDHRFVDEVADGAWLLCEQSSWCWPAHDETHGRTGAVLPDVSAPTLDLGAGEVAAQLAWLDHLLGAQLDHRFPGLRQRLRAEVRRRVFVPLLERGDWHWLGLDGEADNWTAWIHANVLVAALGLAEEDDRVALVPLCLAGLDRFAASVPLDGAIDEGAGYWWNGVCRALEAGLFVQAASRGAVAPLAGWPSLRASVAFPHQMDLGEGWTVSFADAQARRDATQDPWQSLFAAARAVGNQDAARFALSHRTPGHPPADRGLGRLAAAMTDRDWHGSTASHPPYPAQAWFDSVQVLVARQSPGSCLGLTLAIKGGHNDEHHNHNDVGSVVVALDGRPVVIDPGRPTYRMGMFGPDRYQTWVLTSDAHSVPRPLGLSQQPGRAFASRVVDRVDDDLRAGLELELAAAYGLAAPDSWRRTAVLDRSLGVVRITDRWALSGEEASQVQLMLAGPVEQVSPHHLILGEAGSVPLALSGGRLTLERVELDDPLLTQVWGEALTRAVVDLGGLRQLVTTVGLAASASPMA